MTVKSGQSEGTVEVTPSGIPVYYQSKPKRLYRVGPNRKWWAEFGISESELLLAAQGVTDKGALVAWREVPSVTTVLDILDGPPVWWGMQVGVAGVLEMLDHPDVPPLPKYTGLGPKDPGVAKVIDWLKEHELTTRDSKKKGGTRGQSVHDALENWARHGHMPDPSIYPEEEEGYVRGLVGFLKSIPSAEPIVWEVLVASPEHGYAGRYDLRIRTYQPHKVVYHHTPVRGNQYRVLKPGEYLIDLKTSKDIRPSHARQLEAYEQASLESGYEPTNGRGILHVSAGGKHKFPRSWATFHDFKVVLDLYRSEEDMKTRKKAA